MTDGEQHFEAFCTRYELPSRRIQQNASSRTADYELSLCGVQIVVEVKDLSDNPDDREATKRIAKVGWAVWGKSEVGSRIRQKIQKGHEQLKSCAKQDQATILLVYDARSTAAAILTPYEIAAAMYGYETINHASSGLVYRWFGENKQMTPTSRRYISAVGVLNSDLTIDLFLNWHTDRPLPVTRLVEHPAIAVYRLSEDPRVSFSGWQKIQGDP